ncbi:chloride channel protein 2-like isoform X2 [Anneissia japonica]|uniref:chloride channel protein 2-like isoform X2 n=1 Tax=Anneissia japonica TaxID=1529436 RepID=UPI0014258750|nr:chloride channel protein 2-like isoform X2 [Anneissia japonica]
MALQPEQKQLGYEQTLMHGRYTKELGQFAKSEAARLRVEREQKSKEDEFREYRDDTYCQKCKTKLVWIRDWTFSKIGEDWIFLFLLGMLMALLSFGLDYTIAKFQTAHIWVYRELAGHPFLQYLAWCFYPIIFVVFSAGFAHLVAPQAVGSGIPEMKTILRGVVLKEYLNFKTLIAKVVGLATSVGSGLPLGKEGPFVHIASIVSTLLSKFIVTFKGIYENESRNIEMLAAACAVGVSCNFAAPIGGVLFSIEVTSTYFAVRNYWRGFFGAVCGAFVFRLLAVWNQEEETITALFKTNFRVDFPFDPQELIAFSFIGVVCGFGGALFVYLHRKIVDFNRKHKQFTRFLQKNRFIYPTLVALFITSITFPLGLGQFMAAELTQKDQIDELFSNTTWVVREKVDIIPDPATYWENPNVFVTLVSFIVMQFWMVALAITLPVPAGVFMPVFIIGAAFGRLVGESMSAWFPDGISNGHLLNKIVPGGYAVVGAAALSGSVTHTISTSVIVFELTGQITHILPVMIAVLIANAISQLLQPSIYDSIIQIKRLPYLPDISSSGPRIHNTYVEDIMVRGVKFISWLSCYQDLRDLLDTSNLNSFPLVDAPESMILLGSVQRAELEYLLDKKLGRLARIQYTENKRKQAAADSGRLPSQTITPPSRFTIVSYHSNEGNEPNLIIPISENPNGSISSRKSSVADLDDMTPEEQAEWEAAVLKEQIDFSDSQIDPAPFQLVERTSLHKVHSLFSLLGLNHAYVTTLGRLVGVVALKEIRRAVEHTNFYKNQRPPVVRTPSTPSISPEPTNRNGSRPQFNLLVDEAT